MLLYAVIYHGVIHLLFTQILSHHTVNQVENSVEYKKIEFCTNFLKTFQVYLKT